jgi:hypothetical protein
MALQIDETSQELNRGTSAAAQGEAAQSTARVGRSRLYLYAGLLVLIACAIFLDLQSGDSLHYKDEMDYEQIARSIVHHFSVADDTGQLLMGRPPGYPAAIALVYTAIERPVAAKLENAFFLTLAVLALIVLARRIEPRSVALVPYLVLAYPLVMYAATVLYPQVAGCLLITLVVLLVAGERFTSREAAAAGLAYGVLILAIPYFILLLPLVGLFLVVSRAGIKWPAVKPAVLMMIVAAMVVVPWTLRNYVQFHKFVPISTNNGSNLFIGNSPITTANSGRTTDVIPLCKGVYEGMSEYDFDAAMRKCAFDWISQNRAAAAWLYVGKVVNYFNYRNEMATPGEGTQWRDWLVFATYYPLLLLTLARLALARRVPLTRPETLIYLLYFSNAVISAIFFTRMRFRIPFDFLLIAVNAAFLARFWVSRRPARAAVAQSASAGP